jgi:hypothetical protein
VLLDLFGDHKSNVALYPEFQAYFRKHKPPFLAAWGTWGKSDLSCRRAPRHSSVTFPTLETISGTRLREIHLEFVLGPFSKARGAR